MCREELRDHRRRWKTAFQERDVDGIMQFYAPDVVTFDIMPPIQFSGAAPNRQNWIDFFGQFDGQIEIDFAEEMIACEGDIAFVHELTRVGGQQQGKPFSLWTRETNCLRKREGRWLIVHAHASIPVDFQTQRPCLDLVP